MRRALLWAALVTLSCGSALGQANGVPQLAELTASNGIPQDGFGVSVAISGNVVVVGAPDANSNKGAVYVFEKPMSGWANMTQIAELTVPDGEANDAFGYSVGISDNTIVAGAPGRQLRHDEPSGAAYVATLTSHGVSQMAELTASDAAEGDEFGFSVAINGNTVAVGALGKNNDTGAGYVFVKPASGWQNMTQTAELTSSDEVEGQLGITITAFGDAVVAGAWNDNGQVGAAYLFVEPRGGWMNMTQTAELTASDGQPLDYFASSSVALNRNTAVVGAPCAHSSDKGCGPGVAYVFVEPPSGWTNMTETAQLSASDGIDDDNLGCAVSISESAILVGSLGAEINGNVDQGAAYIFTEPKSGWKTTSDFYAKLTASDGTEEDRFGISVSLSSNTGVIGTDPITQNQGKAYVFGN